MAAKEWIKDKTFRFRNDLSCTELLGNDFLSAKAFYGNK